MPQVRADRLGPGHVHLRDGRELRWSAEELFTDVYGSALVHGQDDRGL